MQDKKIAIITSVIPKLNLAFQQNSLPLITEIELRNSSEQCFRDLKLVLTSSPGFLIERTWFIDKLAADTQVILEDIRVELKSDFLRAIHESLHGEMTFTLKSGEEILDVETKKVELLAKDEWVGTRILPEILAAFVQPNDSAVQAILRDASKMLEAGGQLASIEGYQSKSPRRVAIIISALWSAVCKLDLSYANPPASFEEEGQRIRLPSKIAETRLATCLDTSLLFASCLEQSGLNALVIFTKGHAFTGCWLSDDDLSSAVIYDAQSLRKRCQLNELIVFETTLCSNKPPAKFSLAKQEAEDKLNNDEDFVLAIDIKRARSARIKPLSDVELLVGYQTNVVVDEIELPVEIITDIPEQRFNSDNTPEILLDTPEARIENWKRQLLDLTMRNRLLNFTSRSRAIEINCNDIGSLEDMLADNKQFKIISIDTLNISNDPRSEQLYLQQHQENLLTEQLQRHLSKKELIANTDSKKLTTDLLELYRSAKESIQESGANILYISLGFLNWSNGKDTLRVYRAPLILIPIEITRKSVSSGFQLQAHEDEPRFNPTLLEMLKQDFELDIPELESNLPTDDHGLDVKKILNILRIKIKDIAGWEVEESVVVSTFSFAKYLMWNDLCERVDALKESAVVKHLIESPRDMYSGTGVEFPDPRQLDTTRHPRDTFIPLLADSSQIAAVYAAEAGKDFVLIGPPGTGKSQTIANMISQLLATGKTVLFVSEKTAALEVVYRRLHQVGLGDNCLELHSAKAKKSDVIAQLGKAWGSVDTSGINWEKEAERLAKVRSDLNIYVERLHHRYPNGLTAHQAMGVVIKYSDTPMIKLHWHSPTEHSLEAFEALHDITDRIDANSIELVGIGLDIFSQISNGEWSPSWQSEVLSLAGNVQQAVKTLEFASNDYAQHLGLNLVFNQSSQLVALQKLAELLPDAFAENYGFGFSPQGAMQRKELLELSELLEQFHSKMEGVKNSFKRSVLDCELEDLKNKWLESEEKWFLPKWLNRRSVKKVLGKYVGKKITSANISRDLENLIEAKDLQRKVAKYQHLGSVIGKYWEGVDSDTTWIRCTCRWLDGVLSALANVSTDADQIIANKQRIAQLISDQNELLERNAPIGAKGAAYLEQFSYYQQHTGQLATVIGSQSVDVFKTTGETFLFQRIIEQCDVWLTHKNKLRYWCAWRKVRQIAISSGLSALIDSIEQGHTNNLSAKELLLVNYSRWWVNSVIDHDEVLKNFIPAEHRQKIEIYHQLDKDFMQLTQEYVRALLAAGIPKPQEIKKGSEWGVLAREIQKKTRHMPLRQLMSQMPEVITKLTPCVMMSPMSIAQYLPANSKAFDVVIFDEASQITVPDAIGAVARAKQAIVVGDPKQLSPSSFFAKKSGGDDYSDDLEEDMESILDECLAANIPCINLNWHYRSRCESLITFSNHKYYGGKLITFPNNDTRGMSVHYHAVDSIYKEGQNRINRGEAAAIVEDIVTKLRQPSFDKSIGIVTFNTDQQKLISDLFEVARSQYPEIEPHFAEDKFDSVFVKNLESVQGDERDLIYFSITFGKDAAGKLSMNFGPMNQAGGTRRLNVAVTRAKEEMHVFASLKPEQIDLSRTGAEGIKDLKHFLEYAQRGVSALTEAVGAPGGFFDSPFEQAVAERLHSKGWITHSQVGVSGFRIDLGVINPDAPGRYLSAVECDGASYHSSATARDRDFLREQVLRGLGWEVIRIWSTDWWIDSQSALDHVDKQLHKLLADYRASLLTTQTDLSIITTEEDFGAEASIYNSNIGEEYILDAETPDQELECTKKVLKIFFNENEVYSCISDKDVGKQQFKDIHNDAHYYSDPQFRLFKSDLDWHIECCETAALETIVNGNTLTGSLIVTDGMIVGVGRVSKSILKLPVTLRLN
jgi:hypothetical protein